MGMAASQARLLGIVARKTNVEYEGQQINQARLVLSNQSASLFNQMLGLQSPIAPKIMDYTKLQYSFSDGYNSYEITEMSALPENPDYNYTVRYRYNIDDYRGIEELDTNPQTRRSWADGVTITKAREARLAAEAAKANASEQQRLLTDGGSSSILNTLRNPLSDLTQLQTAATAAKAAVDSAVTSANSAVLAAENARDAAQEADAKTSTDVTRAAVKLAQQSLNEANSALTAALAQQEEAEKQANTINAAVAAANYTPDTTDISNAQQLYDDVNAASPLPANIQKLLDDLNTVINSYGGSGTDTAVDTAAADLAAALGFGNAQSAANLLALNATTAIAQSVNASSAGLTAASSSEKSTMVYQLGNSSAVLYNRADSLTAEAMFEQIKRDFPQLQLQEAENNNQIYVYTRYGKTYFTTLDNLETAYKSSDVPIDKTVPLVQYYATTTSKQVTVDTRAMLADVSGSGRFNSIKLENSTGVFTLQAENVTDTLAYDDAMQNYNYVVLQYQKQLEDMNARTKIIQEQDRTLELRLKQLDTEHKALTTEMDAVKSVCDKNVEATFKTFS